MTYFSDGQVTLYHGDALEVARTLAAGSVDCIVTSPPYYGLRDYDVDGQYGLEPSLAEYVETMRALFSELRRILIDDGTLWVNIGDSYASSGGAGGRMASNLGTRSLERPEARDPEKFGCWNKDYGVPSKNLLGVPWRVAFALQDDGWILRNAIVWHKSNAMPESVTDRLSNRYELIFLLSKQQRYWFDLDSVREPHHTIQPFKRADNNEWVQSTAWNHNRTGIQGGHENGRNPGDVWTITTRPCPEAHFAVFPPQLPQRCIMAGCKPGGTVLDPFSGIGTTGQAAQRLGRRYIGIDLNTNYLDLSLQTRLGQATLDFVDEP